MQEFLQFLVLGVVAGAIYFVAASGLVVTYSTSGVFNFAHGALGMVAAFSYWALHVALGWPAVPALLLVVIGGGPMTGALLERSLMRRLRGAPTLSTIGVTIGLLLALVGAASFLWNQNESRVVPGFFGPTSAVTVLGVAISYDQLTVLAIAVVVGGALWLLLHRTRLGVAMRAVVDDPELLALSGISPAATARAGWMLGCSLAALAGVLLVDFYADQNLVILTLTLAVLSTISAAVVGRLRSLPLTFLGAIVLGIAVNMGVGYLPQSWQDLQATIPMVLLFVALLIVPQRRLRVAERVPSFRMPVASLRNSLAGAGALLAVGLLASRLLPSNDILLLSYGVAFAIIGLSLVPLTGYAGQISCCQLTFAGIGAFAMAKVGGDDSPLGLLAAVALAGAVGAVIALPAIRLQGLYLALATLAFAASMDAGFFETSHFGGYGGYLAVGRAPVLGLELSSGRAYLLFLLVVYALAAIGVLALRRGRFGRRLVAAHDSAVAASTTGVRVARTRLAVFALSAALAGLGGALLGGVDFIAEPNDYQMLSSLALLLLLTVWGIRSVSGVLVAGLGLYLIPYWLNGNYSWLYLLTGLGAIGISRQPEGVIGDLVSRLGRRGPGLGGLRGARAASLAPAPAGTPMTPAVIDGDG
ncbi:MAG TPA: ABC transporter permease [Acidimicrobiales bacterium]|nr:ABC transporter permease [Acidimicrobiales bacterium]